MGTYFNSWNSPTGIMWDNPVHETSCQRLCKTNLFLWPKMTGNAYTNTIFMVRISRDSPFSDFMGQSDKASPYSVFMEQSDRTSPYAVSIGQTFRDLPWSQWLVWCDLERSSRGQARQHVASRPRDFQGSTTRTEQGIGLLTIPVLVAGGQFGQAKFALSGDSISPGQATSVN